MSEVRAARAFALLNMAMHDAGVGCWEAKHFCYNPRPSQLDASIKTPIGIPHFPSYTSGHSTFSAAGAAVLSYLFPSASTSFAAMRDEAGHLTDVRRHSLPHRHRSGEGARRPDRFVHAEVRADRRGSVDTSPDRRLPSAGRSAAGNRLKRLGHREQLVRVGFDHGADGYVAFTDIAHERHADRRREH